MDYICNVKYGAFITIARPFFDLRIFFHDFFGYLCAFKMKLKLFLVGRFFKWNRFSNRISIPKCNHLDFRIIFEYKYIIIFQSMWLYDSKFDPHHLQ